MTWNSDGLQVAFATPTGIVASHRIAQSVNQGEDLELAAAELTDIDAGEDVGLGSWSNSSSATSARDHAVAEFARCSTSARTLSSARIASEAELAWEPYP